MISQQEYAHFQTFGFVVFRGLLSAAEIAVLKDEATTAMADAYGAAYLDDGPPVAEVPAFDLPMMAASTPFAASLVAEDPRFWQASHHLMGCATVPSQGEATCFRANTKWHIDMPLGLQGVKFMVYLDACSREEGQLQVVPGSHLPETHRRYWDYVGQAPERQGHGFDEGDWPIPLHGLDTRPGDVIAFHANLMHASQGGYRRFLWDVYYFADPIAAGGEQVELVRDALLHMGDYGDMPFDRIKYPVWREFRERAEKEPAARTALRRLARLGVLDTPGAELGSPKWEPRMGKPAVSLTTGAPPTRR
ncbi:phytanoyl-CoA dioxygenase family protein [Catenulispora subtropica]|uniref:Phytanoyl-CoA dioxygenase n=1 Tax=Catenulispora subtropica TaxID=450798 RepID=A0ABP5EQI6_9ACTN